jgi:uncharacterized protein
MSNQSTSIQQVPAIRGWFTMPPEEPHLMASKCPVCNNYFFPLATLCRNPNCKKGQPMENVKLNNKGKLVTFSVNCYTPPPPYHAPSPFAPFGVGIVSFPEGLSVTGQISAGYEKDLKVGMDMEVVIEKLYQDSQGNDVLAWKFKPVKK